MDLGYKSFYLGKKQKMVPNKDFICPTAPLNT